WKTVNHFGNNQFMAHSQLQKANESDKTLVKEFPALKQLDSPYGTESIMPNTIQCKRDHLMMNGMSIAKAIQLTIQNNTYSLFRVPIFLVFYPAKMIISPYRYYLPMHKPEGRLLMQLLFVK
ncbi:MAG: hypothetical protein M3M88_03075, partial [Thermoproteota archaeon]|nr:hypothetical protein [Thermoproteota archaeon]